MPISSSSSDQSWQEWNDKSSSSSSSDHVCTGTSCANSWPVLGKAQLVWPALQEKISESFFIRLFPGGSFSQRSQGWQKKWLGKRRWRLGPKCVQSGSLLLVICGVVRVFVDVLWDLCGGAGCTNDAFLFCARVTTTGTFLFDCLVFVPGKAPASLPALPCCSWELA